MGSGERLIFVVGNYGSGKTEVAVNLALDLARKGARVQLADLAPTVAELFRLPLEADLQGTSLAGALTGRSAADSEVYFESLGGRLTGSELRPSTLA